MLNVSILLVGLIATLTHGKSIQSPENGKTSHVETKQGEFPYQVFISVLSTLHKHEVEYNCAGTIYDKLNIVTSAQCLYGRDAPRRYVEFFPENIHIYAGSIERYNGTRVTAKGIKIHEELDKSHPENGYDIAIIQLSEPLQLDGINIAAIPLAKENFPVGTRCTVTGWGSRVRNEGSDILMSAELETASTGTCMNWYPKAKNPLSIMCAGGTNGTNACSGDIGGPLVCLENGKPVFAGVVSYGQRNCTEPIPSAFSRISYYNSWIQSTARKETKNGMWGWLFPSL